MASGQLPKRPILFLVGGSLSAVAELGSFVLFKHGHVSTFLAALMSFCAGLAVSYTINSRVVFAALEKRSKREAGKQFTTYVILAVCNALFSSASVTVLQHVFRSAIMAKITLMITTAIWNYFIMKRFVFPDHSRQTSPVT